MRLNRGLKPTRWLLLAVALTVSAWAFLGRDWEQTAEARRRGARVERADAPTESEAGGLVLGEFRLARKAVLDGDTLRVVGLSKSLRLIGLDTEETFKNEKDRRLAEQDFSAYVRAKRGDSPKPVKMGTPVGEEAKRFAEDFFRGVDTVRLERDHPEEIRDHYGRLLAYVFVRKDGRWANYNIEVVRAGLSPYFTKYGYSKRFHDEFLRAQEEAKAARRGIWDPNRHHYPDYEERFAWWNARADFLRWAESHEGVIFLTRWNAMERLRGLVGREAVVVGSVAKVLRKDRVALVLLSRRKGEDFPLVFFDFDVLERSGIERYEYVRAQGQVRLYYDQRRKQEVVEMVITRPDQVTGVSPPWNRTRREEDATWLGFWQ